jgi:RNAse (barnase) inhibitor barstar
MPPPNPNTPDAPDTPPDWHRYSHHDRYRKLQIVRRRWCRRHYGKFEDRSGLTVRLDGAWIEDVPSFYLALGEAINGPGGYFGGCLAALSDCMCGSFGVLPPLTIRLSHYDEVRAALDSRAWCRFDAEHYWRAVEEGVSEECLVQNGYLGDGGEADVAKWEAIYDAAFDGEPFDCDGCGSYFDALLRVFEERHVTLVPETAD